MTVVDVSGEAPLHSPGPNTLCLHVSGDRVGMVVGSGDEQRISVLGRPDAFDPVAAEALARQLTPLYTAPRRWWPSRRWPTR